MKEFFKFLRKESPDFKLSLIFLSSISGVMNGVALAIAITAANKIKPGEFDFQDFLLFFSSIGLFATTKIMLLNRSTRMTENIVHSIRIRIIKKLRDTSLLSFETMPRGIIQSVLSTDAMTISTSAGMILNSLSSLIMLIFITGYLFILSPTALFLVIISMGTCIFYYFLTSDSMKKKLETASLQESQFYSNLDGLFNGFKELKLSRLKADDFYNRELEEIVKTTAELRTEAGLSTNNIILLGSVFIFITMGCVLFLLPALDPKSIPKIGQIITVVFFTINPVSDFVGALPMVSKARASINNIDDIEALIDKNTNELELKAESKSFRKSHFDKIILKDLVFEYPKRKDGNHSFKLGPINMSLDRGEIVFLVGGNGSGKSTLLKTFCGLYNSQQGSVLINGKKVSGSNIAAYRNLFSPIFSDFHIFPRLIGMKNLNDDYIEELLEVMELNDITEISEAGKISNLNLSTGQRKRLALIISVLDDRPIHIFDEWAADQDPTFRKFFYERILRQMKEDGKTVIAATHDDHYFKWADRVLKLEYGELAEGDAHYDAFN